MFNFNMTKASTFLNKALTQDIYLSHCWSSRIFLRHPWVSLCVCVCVCVCVCLHLCLLVEAAEEPEGHSDAVSFVASFSCCSWLFLMDIISKPYRFFQDRDHSLVVFANRFWARCGSEQWIAYNHKFYLQGKMSNDHHWPEAKVQIGTVFCVSYSRRVRKTSRELFLGSYGFSRKKFEIVNFCLVLLFGALLFSLPIL